MVKWGKQAMCAVLALACLLLAGCGGKDMLRTTVGGAEYTYEEIMNDDALLRQILLDNGSGALLQGGGNKAFVNDNGAYLQYENMQGEVALFTATAAQEGNVLLYINAELKGSCWLVYYNPEEDILHRQGPLQQAEDIYRYTVQPGETYFALISYGVTGRLVILQHELDEGITLRGH